MFRNIDYLWIFFAPTHWTLEKVPMVLNGVAGYRYTLTDGRTIFFETSL